MSGQHCLPNSFLMTAALQYRQAIVVRLDATYQEVITVQEQMLRRDGGGGEYACVLDEIHGIGGGDMFEDDAQCRKGASNVHQILIDKRFFPIKNIDVGAGDFAMSDRKSTRLNSSH